MSRHVIGYEGEGRARRPVYADEGPSSAAALGDPVAAVGRLSTDALIPQGGAGPVERRQVTEAERAAWRAQEKRAAPDGPQPEPDEPEPDHEEEPAMPAPAEDQLTVALARVNEASLEAIEAYTGVQVAQRRWDAASDELAAACALLDAARSQPVQVLPAPVVLTSSPAEPKPHRPGGAEERQESVNERAARVLEVLKRHGGDTKAAGVELGMRGNVVARIAQSARARQAKAS